MNQLDTQVKELLHKDKENVWHHISKYNDHIHPLIVKEASGAWITGHDGKQYLDGMAGLWCVNVGYGREVLAQAAYDQIKKMAYMSMTQSHPPAIELAVKLNHLLDDDYVFFYSNSGSDANEVAIKIARQYHQQKNGEPRYKIISRYRAYHGSSMGALSATGQALRKYKYEPLSTGFLHVAPPDNYRKPQGMSEKEYNLQKAREIEEVIIWEQKETVAAVMMEPLITGGGILIPHPIYVQEMEKICKRHGVLLIIDEVICGFARTGKMFGHMHYGIRPDMITMAKGLTSGYLPLSVTAVKKGIYDAFQKQADHSHLRHVNTFGGNPAACAVALKNIEIMEQEELVERAALMGKELLEKLEKFRDHPYVGDIRGLGLLVGIELVEDKTTKKPIRSNVIATIMNECKEKGLIIGRNGETVAGYNNVLTLCPPLTISEDELMYIINTLEQVLHDNRNLL
ncbi:MULTISPECIES: aspartate aminotransferase family protein [Clostridia]|uniref:aspartate aminotransferase family protein n=1 Tax=Clostridia TaxID=186801 RepID=UPI000EA2ED3C|nr:MULTISPECIES: aspartate aminotransferase family protein [Clostridia]NBJ70962.1 aspartate aminotransferase family protein [Roseburia sp. 1XD42-34]RKI75520.1 aspartate aminotransferase family protein [Clostridium sp. 1xD42-85]